jgi:outer membrane protein TolC
MRAIGVVMFCGLTAWALGASAQTRLGLVEAQKLAQEHSYRVDQAYHQSLAARHGLRISKAQRFPTLSFVNRDFYINKLQDVSTFGRTIEIGSKENYQTDVQLTLPLFTGGRISNDIRAKREGYSAASFHVKAEELSTAYRCRQAYIRLMISDRLLLSAKASLARIRILREDVQNLYTSGMADSVDILDAELSLQQALRAVQEKETDCRNASAALATIIGLPTETQITVTESVPPPSWNSDAKPGEPERPELAALDHSIAAARARTSVARSAYLPVLSGFGGYSNGKPNRDLFNKTWNDYFSVGVQLTWDLNLGGKTAAQTDEAVEQMRALEMERKDVFDQLELQAGVAYNNASQAYSTFTVRANEFDIARSKYRLAKDKLGAGHLSVNRLLEFESDLTATEQSYEASILLFYSAVSDYLFAIGSDAINGGL